MKPLHRSIPFSEINLPVNQYPRVPGSERTGITSSTFFSGNHFLHFFSRNEDVIVRRGKDRALRHVEVATGGSLVAGGVIGLIFHPARCSIDKGFVGTLLCHVIFDEQLNFRSGIRGPGKHLDPQFMGLLDGTGGCVFMIRRPAAAAGGPDGSGHGTVKIIDVEAGQLVGLIGPNGAGKTTFVDAVTGFVPHDGTISLDGTDLTGRAPHVRARHGLARTWQAIELFDDLSVRENLTVAARHPSLLATVKELLTGPMGASEAVDEPEVRLAEGDGDGRS